MLIDLKEFNKPSKEKNKQVIAHFNKIKKQKPNRIDELFNNAHDEVFAETDCLTCANCCKTTSPVFKSKDIENIAKYLKIKPSQLVEKYLYMDDEADYVLLKSPCSFLNEDNSCNIYDVRPTACQGYPHTDKRKVHALMELTQNNALVCPAVSEMVKRIDAILLPHPQSGGNVKINRKAR